MPETIYLDYNATTPVAPEVIEAMQPALSELWGNPSSAHALGMAAARAIRTAREQVASLLDATPGEIVFTSGGTESDNSAIIGVAEALRTRGRHLITSVIEHPAVEQPCRYLESRGWDVTRVGVDEDGRVRPQEIAAAQRDDTVLVTVMHSNNETGVIQPIAEICSAARRRGIVVHTDAAQSVGKVPLSVNELGVDLLTVAGHKLYAPKGVGALYVRTGTACHRFLHGAGHEQGRRAGTESTPVVVGLGAACVLAQAELPARVSHAVALRERLVSGLRQSFPDLVVHGARVPRLPNTASVALPGVPAAELLENLPGVAAAAGAACHAGDVRASAVLTAMGIAEPLALATLRLTMGRPTGEADIDEAVKRIAQAATASKGNQT
jgi:cysteine desulfurase